MSRLELIPVNRHHAESMFGILADQTLYKYTGGQPHGSKESLQQWFSALETRLSPDGKEQWLTWIVVQKERNTPIGYVQATIKGMQADVSWLIATSWQGKGYAKEAAAMLKSLLEACKIESLSASIHPHHEASQKVAASLGLRRSGASHEGEEIWAASLIPC